MTLRNGLHGVPALVGGRFTPAGESASRGIGLPVSKLGSLTPNREWQRRYSLNSFTGSAIATKSGLILDLGRLFLPCAEVVKWQTH